MMMGNANKEHDWKDDWVNGFGLGWMMCLESVIGIEGLGSQVESRWGGRVAEGGEKC